MKITKLPNGMGVIKIDVQRAENLLGAMKQKMITQVGILGSKGTAPRDAKVGQVAEEKTNAEIGLKHEFGSLSENIPARSFLQMPLTQNARELAGEKNKLKSWVEKAVTDGKDAKECWRLAFKDLGILAEAVVQRAFEQSGPGWKPNSRMTIELKGPDKKPLIDTAQLRRSIMSRVVEAK